MTPSPSHESQNLHSQNDHTGQDLALPFDFVQAEKQKFLRMIELTPQRESFDAMWEQLRSKLQEPVQDEGSERFSGFTGHRPVYMTGRMGHAALGFHLLRVGGDEYRTITAYRRKIYSDGRRRRLYTADSLSLSFSEILHYYPDARIDHTLGVLATWTEMFSAAAEH